MVYDLPISTPRGLISILYVSFPLSFLALGFQHEALTDLELAYAAQAGIAVFLPPTSQCWDYRHLLPSTCVLGNILCPWASTYLPVCYFAAPNPFKSTSEASLKL